MAQNRDTFEGCTLERNKLDFCRYEYFIVDSDAKRIFEIDNKFYNCKQIGQNNAGGAIEFEYIDQGDNEVERIYDTSFRYFEFSYDIITNKYNQAYKITNDSLGEYREPITEYEINDEEDTNIEVVEKGNKHLVLKAIISDAGDIILDEIVEVVKFIPETESTIVKLYFGRNSKWGLEFNQAYGDDAELWAVVNHKGEFVFPPFRSKVEFIDTLKIFEVGGVLWYGINGNKIGYKPQDFNSL